MSTDDLIHSLAIEQQSLGTICDQLRDAGKEKALSCMLAAKHFAELAEQHLGGYYEGTI